MSTTSALTPAQRARVQGAMETWKAAQRATAALERRLRFDIADAHPDTPPPGTRLKGPDRGVQKELQELTKFSDTHLRDVRDSTRAELIAKGKDVRLRERTYARERLEQAMPELHRLRDAETEALRGIAQAVEEVIPYGGPDPYAASRDHGDAFRELEKLTGRGRRQLNRMRADAAQRRETLQAGLAASHKETDGGVTHSCLATDEE